jgi:hypothetical protein
MAFKKNIDLPTGNPIYVGDRPAFEMDISIITYDQTFAQIYHGLISAG